MQLLDSGIHADQIREFVPMRYTVLGTDGFGRSVRRFEVDRFHIVIAALAAEGKMTGNDVARSIKQYRTDSEKPNPIWGSMSGKKKAA